LIEVMGTRNFGKNWEFIIAREPWFYQMEQSLSRLLRFVSMRKLISCYRGQLGDEEQVLPTIYEIYTGAHFSGISEKIDIHVPVNAGRKNLDFRAQIRGISINVEVKTKEDKFPFDPRLKIESSIPEISFYGGSRAGADLRYTEGELIQESTKPDIQTPHSTELRDLVNKALSQFPDGSPNILVLGHISGKVRDLEDAIYGDLIREGEINLERGYGSTWRNKRLHNGLFRGLKGFEAFNRLSAIIWLHLNLRPFVVWRRSRMYINPHANYKLHEAIKADIIRIFDRRQYLHKELERLKNSLIEFYKPQRIILFGSLTGDPDAIHESSDIDLVVIRNTHEPFFERSRKVIGITRPKVGVNLLIYTPKEFDSLKSQGNFFIEKEIIEKGHILYEQRK